MNTSVDELMARVEEDMVAALYNLPNMRTLAIDQNPRLRGCLPRKPRIEAQLSLDI